ncbi:oxaloacetate carrier [Rhizoctonia solani AG-1 IA]|uniref:Oxaloacetate carrier n=1 Tax=Thanatephorus cucumeris (strain AG1-IA) TaxID=983506 RepID=L8WEX5_THACA|nr:oxaloacetate carrier [Rhizoctonia solani AG-1 IA]
MSSSVKPLATFESFGIGARTCRMHSGRFHFSNTSAERSCPNSNPQIQTAEVAKTRLQLQGELQSKGAPKVYKNVFDVFIKTWKNEGIRGVQRGLGPAVICIPGTIPNYGLKTTRYNDETMADTFERISSWANPGFYEPFRRSFNSAIGRQGTEQVFATSIAAGAASGLVGACLGNPLFLIKARMQAYSPALPVGAQHYYRNSFAALAEIFKAEGLRGYIRGMDAAILRTCMGSSVSILFNYRATTGQKRHWSRMALQAPIVHGHFWRVARYRGYVWYDHYYTTKRTYLIRVQCLVMQPADTALTRMYNQPTVPGPNGRMVGALYKNPIDCLWKTLKIEGPLAWYKGSTAHFLRIAP